MPSIPQPALNAVPSVGDSAPKTYPQGSLPVDPSPPAISAAGKRPFRQLLKQGDKHIPKRALPDSKTEAGDNMGGQALSNPGQWFRAEIPADPSPRVRQPLKIQAHQRVLVASGGPPQARIEISSGRLAGSQIHLTANGHRIEAQLLTGNEASRQTLMAAMDAVRDRLRVRGVLLGAGVARRTSQTAAARTAERGAELDGGAGTFSGTSNAAGACEETGGS